MSYANSRCYILLMIALLGFACLFHRAHASTAEDTQTAIADVAAPEDNDNLEEDTEMSKRVPFGGGSCTTNADCNYNGDCNNTVCTCQNNYAGAFCQHKLKSKLTSFLLAFFVGQYGAMRFYLGYTGDGVGKIILIVGGILVCCFGICMGGASSGVFGAAAENPAVSLGAGIPMIVCAICCALLGFCALLASWLWWIIDWGLILSNKLDDNEGYPLAEDM